MRQQRGRAVTNIVMGAPLDPARSYRPDRLGALQRLDLGLLVHTDHDRVRRWVQVEPDHVADLGLQLRIGGALERLGLPRLDVMLGPDPRDRAVADAELGGQQPARPVSDAKRLGRWREGGGQYLGAPVTPNRLWAAGAGSVGQLASQPLARIPAAPGDHRGTGDAQSLSDLGIGDTLGGQQQQLGPPDQGGWDLGGARPAPQDRELSGRNRKGGSRRRHPQILPPTNPTVKSPQRRTTRGQPAL